ncbi:hypothetical protein [Actinoalloteichus fjordicus]|uniref:Uncharacterized protein n=1 Tax=Actinoalloteichus fjordicus TaxID=1612552 RepID=A0AAC9L8E9_9PSEU|nr:hypothetical protein [Actinoalloteichus fjordicus]APU13078.1 hypothetical protein UA74_05010 [Actinoalloteichus fjordicus]
MGKGRRLRQRRQTTADERLGEMLASYPFIVDPVTATRLGPDGLAALARNLWPQDCQTCGWALGADRATVAVSDLIVLASATLHHARCRKPQWETSGSMHSQQDLLSWTTQTFLLQAKADSTDDRPIFLVNPALEQTMLKCTATGWRSNTIDSYSSLGLTRSRLESLLATEPVPDISAHLDAEGITVRLDDTGQSWNTGCDGPTREAVKRLGGILLAVTTAFDPHDLRELGQFLTLIRAGEAAVGWVALAGTGPGPLSEQPLALPTALNTFVLHLNLNHAFVGELIAITDGALAPLDAQEWAQDAINLPASSLIGWRQTSNNLHTWHTIDSISAKRFILRKCEDGWQLIRVAGEINGKHGLDRDTARDWATRAARTNAKTRIINWLPTNSNDDVSITFHGSGIPR